MFGYRTDEIVGTDVAKLFTPEDRAIGVPGMELAQARKTGRAADERYHMRKDGTRFYCSGVTQRLGGGGRGFAKIARDLTAQQVSAETLQHAHEDLETRVLMRTKELEALVAEHQTAKNAVTSLLHQLVNAQESERLRIARDLHDHFGQQITTLRLALERTQKELPVGADEIAPALALLGQIGRDLDFLAWELRPAVLDELGLAAALPRFVTEWAAHVGIQAECRFGEFESGQLARDAEIAFYRVTQEALNNVSKHAHASRVDVVLASTGGKVVLVVEDNGVGFEPSENTASRGFGLASMRERAALVGATLEVESAPGEGTSVFLRCPIRNEQDAGDDAKARV